MDGDHRPPLEGGGVRMRSGLGGNPVASSSILTLPDHRDEEFKSEKQ